MVGRYSVFRTAAATGRCTEPHEACGFEHRRHRKFAETNSCPAGTAPRAFAARRHGRQLGVDQLPCGRSNVLVQSELHYLGQAFETKGRQATIVAATA